MPSKEELQDMLDSNNKVFEKKDRLLKENLKQIEKLNTELDALQAEFDRYQEDSSKNIVEYASSIAREMIQLARMESPIYAIAYAEAALERFPLYPEDNTVDLSRVAPNPQVFLDLSRRT